MAAGGGCFRLGGSPRQATDRDLRPTRPPGHASDRGGRPRQGPRPRRHHARARCHRDDPPAHRTRSRLLPATQGGLRRTQRPGRASRPHRRGLPAAAASVPGSPRGPPAQGPPTPGRATRRVRARVVAAAGHRGRLVAGAGAAALDRRRRGPDVPPGLRLPVAAGVHRVRRRGVARDHPGAGATRPGTTPLAARQRVDRDRRAQRDFAGRRLDAWTSELRRALRPRYTNRRW